MSTSRATTDQNAAPADATEEGPTDQDDQGVIVTAQPPRSEDDADSDSAAGDAEQTTDRQPEDRTTAR